MVVCAASNQPNVVYPAVAKQSVFFRTALKLKSRLQFLSIHTQAAVYSCHGC